MYVFEEGIWVNEKSSHKVQPPLFHLQLVAQRQAGVHMQLKGRKTRWQVQKFSHCFRLTLHATTIRHTLVLWKCQGEPHLRLYIKLWVAGISTVEYQNGNKRIGGRRGDVAKESPVPFLVLLDEFVQQILDVSLETSCGMAPFSDALIPEWLLSSQEIPWNQFFDLRPVDAMGYLSVTTGK